MNFSGLSMAGEFAAELLLAEQLFTILRKVVIPAKAGIQRICNGREFLDSRLRGNDRHEGYSIFHY